MATLTKIEWADTTWNPVTGCSKISPGCTRCYAERMSERLRAMGLDKYQQGFDVTVHASEMRRPKTWRTPQRIFVCSMGDLFHRSVPGAAIEEIFRTMNECPHHIFYVLTKRPRAVAKWPQLWWSRNVWLGASVEHDDWSWRADVIRMSPAARKFLSLEPLLGPVGSLRLDGIDWVIAGGESGPGARPMDPVWVRDVRDRCAQADVPFFFKQWGGTRKGRAGNELDGRQHVAVPQVGRGA